MYACTDVFLLVPLSRLSCIVSMYVRVNARGEEAETMHPLSGGVSEECMFFVFMCVEISIGYSNDHVNQMTVQQRQPRAVPTDRLLLPCSE